MNTSGTNYMLSVHFGSDSVLPQQPGSKTHTKRTRSVATEVPSTRLPVRAGPSSRSLHQASQLQRKPRLPWLDGSQSRKASLPLAPGAFSDNDDDGEKVGHTTSDQLDWPVPTPTRPAPGPHTQHIAPPASGPRLDLPHLPLVAPTQDDSRPAVPLIALARELYKTDTSAAISESDTDRSMRDARRRALQDPSARSVQMSRERSNNSSDPLPAPAPPAVPASSAFRSSRIVKTETPSPSTSSLNRESTVERSSSVDSLLRATIAVDRRGSTSLQPIRSKRVTIAPEDLPPEARLARRQTLSVQPLKSSRLSRSFDDDLSSDVVKTSRGISIASQSPSERDLRNSIAGLESLMQEAVQLAKEAANNGRSEEVPGIMDEARLAMHRATNVPQDQATTRAAKKTRSPVSSSESSSSSSSEELPAAAVPRASHRIPRSGFFSLKDGPTSDQGSIMRASSPGAAQAVWDEDYPNHRLDPPTKPEDPRSIDFALSPAARLVAVAPGVDKGKTREGLQNQQRPPAPTRIPSNPGASKPVLPTREQVREHIQEHLEPPIPPRQSSLANLNNLGVLEGTTSPEIPPTDAAPRTESQSANADPIVSSTLTQRPTRNWGRDKYDDKDYSKTIDLRGKHHFTLREGERFSIHHGHKRQPIARNWGTIRKRFVALVTCGNTALIGTLIGIYAGEVPAIQYPLADLNHQVILGNVWLYIGMAITTFLFWPLPLLHGRKPYTLVALGIALPLQIPQAIIVQDRRRPVDSYSGYLTGLLLCRGLLGLALGFAHMNFKATLLDLFGASLQSEFPHGEVVITDDVRRHGGGMGYWLGIWSFCFLGSLALGFLIGADVISALNQAWGFYICVILIALALFINVLTPETRRSPHRRTMQEVELPNDSISRRVARGEIKMHVNGDGPKWWWEEVFAGVYLSLRMLLQSGFLLMALYMAWIYAQIVLIIVVCTPIAKTDLQ